MDAILRALADAFGYDAVQEALDSIRVAYKCRFCDRLAEYEGWYRVTDFASIDTGLLQRSSVCEEHKYVLIGVQDESEKVK